MAALVLISVAMGFVASLEKFNGANLMGLGTGLLATIGAVYMVGLAIVLLSFIPKETLIKGGIIAGAILTALALFTLAVGAIKTPPNPTLFTSYIGLVAALLLMAGLITILGHMNAKTFIQGALFVGIMLTELAVFSLLTSLVKNPSIKGPVATALSMIGLAVALMMMCQVIKTIGSMSITQISKGFAVMTLMMAELLIVSKLASIQVSLGGGAFNMGKSAGQFGSMIGMAFAILALSAVVFLLGNMSASVLGKGFAAMTIMLIELGILMAVMQNLPHGTVASGVSNILTLFGIATTMLILAAVLYMLGKMKTSTLVKGVLSITVIMLAMAAVLRSLGRVANGSLGGSIVGLIAMVGILTLVAGALYLLSEYGNVDKMLPIALAITAVILGLAAAMIAISVVGALGIQGVAVGLLGFIGFIATLAAVAMAFGTLT